MTNSFMGIYEFSSQNIELFNKIIKPLVETHTGLAYVDAMSYYGHGSVKMGYIEKLIEEANLVIVDLSIKNTNVFLEYGIAWALKKKIVLICSKECFDNIWCSKMPFDIQGLELIIFKDVDDLKVRLGTSILDVLFKTNQISVSWDSVNALNHVQSCSEIIINDRGKIWSNKAINSNCIIKYSITIIESENKNPDVRLYFSTKANEFPQIACIFPWENSDIDKDKYECHIDYFKEKASEINDDPDVRLQQVTVADKIFNKIKNFRVSVSFHWPNMVVESEIFENEKNFSSKF